MDTVLKLRRGTKAWNVDGSGADTLVDDDGRPVSWISYWREVTGKRESECGYIDCDKTAAVGGHLYLRHRRRYAIVPICAGCNHPSNAARQQQGDGRQPTLRAVFAVQVTKTAEMRAAPRRIACARRCEECGDSLEGRPKSLPLCYECFRHDDRE